MKKTVLILTMLLALLTLVSCGTKVLHCDKCGKETEVPAGDKREEDWILYCEDCKPDAVKELE